MDLDHISSKLANLTMYDVKSLYRQARNYALNVSEIEAKVDEATNDDPWGASSTLMQEIAQATNNFQDFNEIMPTIYRRFMEKEAREWRQIYKALQLLEYLVKHGSERVVDDARSHLATIKILRNFHYIDEKGKDQGINVRNRAKELADLLGDVDRIRQERRKARSNKTKYTGGGNGEFVPGSGTRYGGFGSDSYYAGGGAAGAGAGSSTGAGSTAARDSFEEYDAGDYEETPAARPSSSTTRAGGSRSSAAAPPKKEAPKVADLFSFDDDDEPAASAPASAVATQSAADSNNDAFGDDFDDFQAAPAPTPAVKPAAAPSAAKSQTSASFDFFDSAPIAPAASKPASTSVMSPTSSNASKPTTPAATSNTASRPAASTNSSFNFDDLWAASSGKSSNASGKQKLSMAEMAKNQSSNALFGSSGTQPAAQQQAANKKDIFDLL
ncbi:related to ENT3-cytoskeletal adaptor [Ustilago bromivora]|uniref:Related to ENT3 - cytoskeletal adaptor n=1 Tax=Ustilago bromivora TaxID=307758 RepID=A0A1K0GDF5_9BASI|nr:related to ENT3-cytoskeletal adaptor [Ustilago bromivora]SYW80747.1 related to ENT3 - cytoskeletal adaptor [Ustilago bromivora]